MYYFMTTNTAALSVIRILGPDRIVISYTHASTNIQSNWTYLETTLELNICMLGPNHKPRDRVSNSNALDNNYTLLFTAQ